MSELQFKILSTDEEIAVHLDEWKHLSTNPQAHPDVVLRLCRNDPDIIKPFIPILVDDQGRIACMFSSRLEKAHIGRDSYLRLPKSKVRKMTIPMGGIFGRSAPENVSQLLEKTLKAIDNENVDLLELPALDSDDPLLHALERSKIKRFHSAFSMEDEHWQMEIAEDFDKQMLILGKSTRGTLRHNLNRFNRLYEGRFEIKVYSEIDDMREALTLCTKIDEHSYHKGLGVNIKTDQRTVAVYEGLANQGGLEICILSIDGEPLAFLNSAVIKNRRFGTQMGFNPEFCKYPLGTILLFETIRRYINTGHRETFDFGIGKADYKSRLCTSMKMAEQKDIRTRRALFSPSYAYMMGVFYLGIAAKSIMLKLNMEEFARRNMRRFHKRTRRSS
jgi:hypothetical protein